MNRNRKSITALLLLTIVSIPGFLLVHYQITQVYIHHQMEEKLEKQYMQTVRVPLKYVKWYKKDKEVIIDGKLFDIKSIDIENEIAVFKGLFDEKETLLKEKITQFQSQQEKNKEHTATVTTIVSILLFYEENCTPILHSSMITARNYAGNTSPFLISSCIATPAPPPKA